MVPGSLCLTPSYPPQFGTCVVKRELFTGGHLFGARGAEPSFQHPIQSAATATASLGATFQVCGASSCHSGNADRERVYQVR